jgi:hypothetical protein
MAFAGSWWILGYRLQRACNISKARSSIFSEKILPEFFNDSKNGIYSTWGHCRICQREVFSKLLSPTRRLEPLIQQARGLRTRRTTRATCPNEEGKRIEFRPNDRNVEAPAASTVQPANPPARADLGSASYSGCALPLWLARPHPSLSRLPRAVVCTNSSL